MKEFSTIEKTEYRIDGNFVWTYEEYWNTYFPQLPDGGVIATLWDKLPVVILKTKPKYDSEADTLKHIKRVNELLLDCSKELMNRAQVHDDSKLKDPEKALFDLWTPLLKESTYGSPEYKKMLEGLKPSLEHHYKHNSHHPEHYKNGVDDMDLFDIMEMLMDWKAATERHNDGDIFKSISINKERFKMSEQLCQIYRNTVLNMQWKNFCDDPELIKRIETARTKK